MTFIVPVLASVIYGIKAASDGLVLQSLNLETGQIQDQSDRLGELSWQSHERLTGLVSLPGGILMLVSTYGTDRNTANRNRIVSVGTSPISLRVSETNLEALNLDVSELNQNSTIESLLITNDDSLFTIVSEKAGIPPLYLATINRQTGQVRFIADFSLPPEQQFGNLTQCPDGTIYATSIGREGYTRLVQIDLQRQQLIELSPLRFKDQPWLNDLSSLACSLSGQLYGLGDPEYTRTNSLFTVNVSTGAMSLVREFGVDKITFARP